MIGSVSHWQLERNQLVSQPYSDGPLPEDAETEVAIIGGGITGTSAALWLARAGVQVGLVEGRTVAAGASGRNGGFLLGGTSETYADAIERYGHERTKRIWAFSQTNNALATEIIAELSNSHWRCGYHRTGSLRIASTELEFDNHRRSVDLLREDGWQSELVVREQLPHCLQASYHGGIYYPEDGEIQPALLVTGLAWLAHRTGARLYEYSPVRAIQQESTGFILQTEMGILRAQKLILATNAWLPELGRTLGADWLEKCIKPTRGQMLTTAPISEQLLDCPCYANEGYEYFRQLGDGRLAIGGWRNMSFETENTDDEATSGPVQEHLEHFLRVTLRQQQVPIEQRWAGIMAFSSDGLPLVGALPGVANCYLAGGYTGHGNAYALLSAHTIAHAILGDHNDDADLFLPERFLVHEQSER